MKPRQVQSAFPSALPISTGVLMLFLVGCDAHHCLSNVKGRIESISDAERTQLVHVVRAHGMTGTIADLYLESYEGKNSHAVVVKMGSNSFYNAFFVTKIEGVWQGVGPKEKAGEDGKTAGSAF